MTYQFPFWFRGAMYIFFVISAVTLLALLLLAFDVAPNLELEPLAELQPIRMVGVVVFFAIFFQLAQKLLSRILAAAGCLVALAAIVFSFVTVGDYVQVAVFLALMMVGMGLFYLNRKTSLGHASLQLQLLAFLSVIYIVFYKYDESMNVFMQAIVGVPYVLFYWVLMSAARQMPPAQGGQPTK